jgi:DNA-binding response OmpR family regulator
VRVLVVEDDQSTRTLVRKVLEREGFVVEEVADGRQALDEMRTSNHDLVILDLGLPEIGGLAVLARCREVSSVPVIVLTGRADETDRAVGMELGADDYLVKPFFPRELVARVHSLMRRASRFTAVPPPAPTVEPAVGPLAFGVLGPLEIRLNGTLVELTAPKHRAVLTVLLIDANRVVSLDRLVDLLWSGEPPAQAVGSLQAYISHLRRALEPGRARSQPAQVLVSRAPGYAIVADADSIDAGRFELAVEVAQKALADNAPHDALSRLDAALRMWRGPALAEFAQEPFARVEAERLEELRRVALECRIDARLQVGQHQAVIPELEQLVAEYPLRERLAANLMLALYRSGRQSDALRTFQRCRTVLGEELGLEPSLELRQLEADILAQAPSLSWRPSSTDAKAILPPVLGPGPVPEDGVAEDEAADVAPVRANATVGRARELDLLSTSLSAARSGRGNVVLIGGEAGIGKTTLLVEFGRHVSRLGGLMAWGRGYQGEGAPAFWLWAQVMHELVALAGPEVAAALEETGVTAAQLAPLLRDREPAASDAPTSMAFAMEDRFRLYQSFSVVLEALASRTSLVIALDDLQWADPDSLKLLDFLSARLERAAVLVVATYREGEVGTGSPLTTTLAALSRLSSTQRLSPRPFTPPELASYLALMTEVKGRDDIAGLIHARTGGNPFFVAELVKLLASEGSLADPTAVRASEVPAGVRDVIRRRLDRLPEQTNALLSVAAVIGMEFDMGMLEEVSQLDEDVTEAALEIALVDRVVIDSPGRSGHYQFSHGLIRQALREEVSSLRRCRLHARAARAMESRAAGDHAGAAYHSLQAGGLVPAEKMVAQVLAAADKAKSQLGFGQAEDLLVRALTALESRPATDGLVALTSRVQDQLALLLHATRGMASPEAAAAWEASRHLHTRLGTPRELVTPVLGLSMVHSFRSDHAQSVALSRQLIVLGGETGDDSISLAGHMRAAGAELYQGNLQSSGKHLASARDLLQRVGEPEHATKPPYHTGTMVRIYQAYHCWLTGDRRWRRWRQEAIDLQRGLDHPLSQGAVLIMQGWLVAGQRSVSQAVAQAGVGADRLIAIGAPELAGLGRFLAAWGRHGAATYGDQTKEMEKEINDLEAAGILHYQPQCLGYLAEAHRRVGNLAAARATVDRALAMADRTGERYWKAELLRIRASIGAAQASRFDEVRNDLDHAIEVAISQGAAMLERRARATAAAISSRSS